MRVITLRKVYFGIAAKITVNISFRDNSFFGITQKKKKKNVFFKFVFANKIDERMTTSGNQQPYGSLRLDEEEKGRCVVTTHLLLSKTSG